MEFRGGAGERDTSFDPRHLALLIAASVIALLSGHIWRTLRAQAKGDRDFHRLLQLRLSELPACGRGPRFFVAVAAMTFGMGGLAHIGERSPSHTRDALAWVVVALLVSVIAAVVARFIARVLPDFIAANFAYFVAIDSQRILVGCLRDHEPTVALRECWSPPLFSRPPPLQA